MSNWSDQTLYVMIFILSAGLLGVITYGSYAAGVKDTIKEAQRSAVIAGAARWSSNRETGEAQFDYVTCLKPEGLK